MKKIVLKVVLFIFFLVVIGIWISLRLSECFHSDSISQESWMLFFGSYLGAIIGSLVAVVSIVITLISEQDSQKREFKKRDEIYYAQMKDSAKSLVIPAFSLREVNPASENTVRDVLYDMAPFEGKIYGKGFLPGEYGVMLILKSIGLGSAWFPEIVSIDNNGLEHRLKICPENDVFETGEAIMLTITNTLDVDGNYTITTRNRERLPIHHEINLRCKDIYMNEYNFIIHLYTRMKKTVLYNGNWGDYYELRLDRLENLNFKRP